MARTAKRTVDYFPHVVKHGRTLFVLESRWRNDGYAFLFKTFETICESDGMVFDFKDPMQREVFLAKALVTENEAIAMMDVLARLGSIDQELWETHRMVWAQDLVDNLGEVWRKRSMTPLKPEYPARKSAGNPHFRAGNRYSGAGNAIKGAGNTQSKVEESREEERGTVFHNDNDNVIDSDKGKTDTPPLAFSDWPAETAGERGAADGSDATIKGAGNNGDVLAVAAFYCEAKKLTFVNEAAKAAYLRAGAVYLPAQDLLALAGGDVALAQRAIKEHASYYSMPMHEGKKAKWDLRWVRDDFQEWDTERREFEKEAA